MKIKRIFSIVLASIFIIPQAVIAIDKESKADRNGFTNVKHYTEYTRAVNPNDPVTIPDLQLKALINKTLDTNRSETQTIKKSEMESLTTLSNKWDFSIYKVYDLTGLEYAVNLKKLTLEGDKKNILYLKNIDILQHLTNLESLYIYYLNLSKIDISKNIKLNYLDLSYNNLSTIDVSNNTMLTYLSVSYNNLSIIDLSKNINLSNLYLYNNNLSSLDLTNNINIVRFLADDQKIGSNLDDVTLQGDKVIIKNRIKFNRDKIANITGTGVTYSPDKSTVTIDNPSKSKLVSYNFSNVDNTFSGTVTIDLSVTGVALSSKNSTLKVGETLPLTATVLPNAAIDKSLTWTSSNEKIATVDPNGLVTAVGEGTATITVKTNDGGFIATSNITVNHINQGAGDSSNNTSSNGGIANVPNPTTGESGLANILSLSALGLVSIFISRKRKK